MLRTAARFAVLAGSLAAVVALAACDEYEVEEYVQDNGAQPEFAECCNSDSPECQCFKPSGAWDPPAGVIQDVALSTLGTFQSCVEDGGKPFYQMREGLNSLADAQLFACTLEDLAPYIDDKFARREAWCSEAISYWHREAETPYPGGFRNNEWTFTWQLDNANAVRVFYEAEGASKGRGRWIHWSKLDYENLQLGVNAPLPGSFVFIRGYDDSSGREKWVGEDHSMMIDELTVYRTTSGKVERITATIVEGSLGSKVTNTRVINDLLEVTPKGGGDVFFDGKKILGFGVDLDGDGLAMSDSSRLHTIVLPHGDSEESKALVRNPRHLNDIEWSSWYGPMVDALVPFIERLRSAGGPVVTASDEDLQIEGIPDRKQYRWVFSEDGDDYPGGEIEIQIDLLGDHPVPIRQILFLWSGHELPLGYGIRFAASDGEYVDAAVPEMDSALMRFNQDGIAAMPVPVMLNPGGAKVRYIEMIFPAGSLAGVRALEEMRFEYKWGPN